MDGDGYLLCGGRIIPQVEVEDEGLSGDDGMGDGKRGLYESFGDFDGGGEVGVCRDGVDEEEGGAAEGTVGCGVYRADERGEGWKSDDGG